MKNTDMSIFKHLIDGITSVWWIEQKQNLFDNVLTNGIFQ